MPLSFEVAKTSGGGVFLLDPQGEATNNEEVLAGIRERGMSETVWKFTQKIYDDCTMD